MANGIERQYVGARYVPVFFNNPDGTWDWAQGFQYEPLTIVKYGENTYTSKMLVPSNVGSPNLNPEYWAQTGNYNGAIISLQTEVDNMKENLSIINIADYGARGDGVTDDTNAFKSAFSALNGQPGIIYLQNKRYKISSSISMQPQQWIEGNKATIIMADINTFTDGYLFLINATKEDVSINKLPLGFGGIKHLNIYCESQPNINLNGIMNASHSVFEDMIFSGINKCIRCSAVDYIDNCIIENIVIRQTTPQFDYAINLGELGDARLVRNIGQSAAYSGTTIPIIYAGEHVFGADISFVIGNAKIYCKGEASIHNCFLSYYGQIITDSQAVVVLSENYFSLDYLRSGRCILNGYDATLKNCYFIYAGNVFVDDTGNPIQGTYITLDNVIYSIQRQSSHYEFDGSSRIDSKWTSDFYKTISMPSAFSANASAEGKGLLPPGSYSYSIRIVWDTIRQVGKTAGVGTSTATLTSAGAVTILGLQALKGYPLVVKRNDGKSVYIPELFGRNIIDNGVSANGIVWTETDYPDSWYDITDYTKYGDNVIVHINRAFSTPQGTWTAGDIIYSSNGKYVYNGSTWSND